MARPVKDDELQLVDFEACVKYSVYTSWTWISRFHSVRDADVSFRNDHPSCGRGHGTLAVDVRCVHETYLGVSLSVERYLVRSVRCNTERDVPIVGKTLISVTTSL